MPSTSHETPSVEELAQAVDSARTALADLEEIARLTAEKYAKALEDFHAAGLKQIVRSLKADPRGKELLFELVDDPLVHTLFAVLGIIKQPIESRVQQALEQVRPVVQSHGGDVELVRVEAGTAFLRLHGSCNGCSMSAATLREGIEEAIRDRVPEITTVEEVKDQVVAGFIPVESLMLRRDDDAWVPGPMLASVTENVPAAHTLAEQSILLVLHQGKLFAYRNQCPHQGLPLERGAMDGCMLTCPWHGFRFDVTSGECHTAPQVQLLPYATRIQDGQVWVRVEG